MSHVKLISKQYLGQNGSGQDTGDVGGLGFWDWWVVGFQAAISVLSIFDEKLP
jgi:hypothetical protein